MSWMALDLGTRRVGIAVSDPSGIIAQPFATLETGPGGSLPMARLRAIAAERQVTAVVVGLPLRLDGSPGPEAVAAEAAADALRRDLGIEVVLWDERLTSVQAERLLVDAGMSRRRRKGATDRIAAALILQSYLDRRLSTKPA